MPPHKRRTVWTEAELRDIYDWWRALRALGTMKSKAAEYGVRYNSFTEALAKARRIFEPRAHYPSKRVGVYEAIRQENLRRAAAVK